MDSPQPAPSTLESLRTVEFRQSLKGYNVDDVDEYLEKAAVEAEALQEQVRQVMERLRQASERIAQLEHERREAPAAPAPAPADAGVPDESLQRTLLLAQKFVDQAKRESEATAAELVAQAQAQANATLSDAERRAKEMTTEAEQRLREEVSRLESMRGQLATDVENMARHLESERNRLHTTLSEVLKWVDDNIQPANSLMALRPRGGEQPRPATPQPARVPGPPRAATPPAPGPPPRPAAAPPAPAPSAAGMGPGAPASDTVAQVLDLQSAPIGERG
jgi:cell division initiation protein